jgi:peptidoglycan/xylan/chitin deacetylase (PgdA/CDA1 family)
MTRKFAAILLLALLPFAGCKKIHALLGKKEAAEPTAVLAAPAAPGAPAQEKPAPIAAAAAAPGVPATAPAAPAAPSKPDLLRPNPVKAAVDTSASAMVLCFHNVEDGHSNALTITTAEFEKELKAVKDAGFSVIPLQDFLAWRRGEKTIPHKSCVITLDDGWVSGYNNSWPILKKYGFPFTLFIYIEYVGSGGKSMSWDQLAEMRDAGVDIECHTYTHSNLHGKGNKAKVQAEIKAMGYEPWLRKELIDSKKVLEEKLGIKVNCLAYPYGVWNSVVRGIVKEAGYEAAFTVYGQRLTMHSPPSDLLGRYAVEMTKPKIFQEALSMTGGGVAAPDTGSSIGQLAAASMITKPMNGETINTTRPVISANLATMGTIDPATLKVFLSGVGPLQVQFSPDTKMMNAPVLQPIKPGAYSVIVSAKVNGVTQETRWTFNVSSTATSATPVPGAAATPIPPTPPRL